MFDPTIKVFPGIRGITITEYRGGVRIRFKSMPGNCKGYTPYSILYTLYSMARCMIYIFCTLEWQGSCFIYSVLSGCKVHALYILYSQVARYMLYIFCTLRLQGTCSIYSVLSGCKVDALYILYSQVARYMLYMFYTFR